MDVQIHSFYRHACLLLHFIDNWWLSLCWWIRLGSTLWDGLSGRVASGSTLPTDVRNSLFSRILSAAGAYWLLRTRSSACIDFICSRWLSSWQKRTTFAFFFLTLYIHLFRVDLWFGNYPRIWWILQSIVDLRCLFWHDWVFIRTWLVTMLHRNG